MKRTQIYLTTEQWQTLQTQSQKERKTMAELIRFAIDKVYRQKKRDNFKQALLNSAGIWSDRTDIETTDEYIRKLRAGNRLKRFGLDK